jgi:hypothetical protein
MCDFFDFTEQIWSVWENDYSCIERIDHYDKRIPCESEWICLESRLKINDLIFALQNDKDDISSDDEEEKTKIENPVIWRPEIEFEKLKALLWSPSETNEFLSRNLIIDKAIEVIFSERQKIDRLYKKGKDDHRFPGQRNCRIPSNNSKVLSSKSSTHLGVKRITARKHSTKLSSSLNNLLKLLCYPTSFISDYHDDKTQVQVLREAFDKVKFLRSKREALLHRIHSSNNCISLI